jgi:myo-inositol-1(or 4)-monophosphatase
MFSTLDTQVIYSKYRFVMQDFLKQIIKEGGDLSKEYFDRGVTFKEKTHIADLLTEADIAVNDFLLKKIQETYPDHKITSEEADQIGPEDAEYEWVIDPIDGTRNFAKGIPSWCVIIAVMRHGEPYLGAVYSPVANELFFAKKDHGASMNGMPIRVCEKKNLDFACGSISSMKKETEVYGRYIEQYKVMQDRLNHETHMWHHHFGNMLGMCYLASGGFDFFIQNAGLDHDYLAPVLIAKEAGATVTNSDGEPWQRGRQDLVAAPPALHKLFMEFFSPPKEK